MGEVLAVLSGKGGTGKTSVCAGLSTALAESGKRVLCVDCDVGLRNLDISLGMPESSPLSFLDVLSGHYSLSSAARHDRYPSLCFLTAPMNCTADEIDPDAFCDMLRQARQEFDMILLDAPAGVDAGFRLAAAAADRFLLVTGFGPAAVRDAARTAQVLELMGKKNIRLVVNRVEPKLVRAMDTTIDDVMDTAGLPLLGIVPEDKYVTLAATFNQPLLKYKPRCAASKACMRIAKRILGLPEPISIR